GLALAAAAAEPPRPAGDAEDLHLTSTGALVGTPAYMAPEQLAGERADARADLFSFCVALYGALYRQPPFPIARMPAPRGACAPGPRATPPPPAASAGRPCPGCAGPPTPARRRCPPSSTDWSRRRAAAPRWRSPPPPRSSPAPS